MSRLLLAFAARAAAPLRAAAPAIGGDVTRCVAIETKLAAPARFQAAPRAFGLGLGAGVRTVATTARVAGSGLAADAARRFSAASSRVAPAAPASAQRLWSSFARSAMSGGRNAASQGSGQGWLTSSLGHAARSRGDGAFSGARGARARGLRTGRPVRSSTDPKAPAEAAVAVSSPSPLPTVLGSVRGALARIPKAAASLVPSRARAAAVAVQAPGAARRVASLQLNALWQRHGGKLLLLAGAFVAYFSWRIMYGVATSFVNLSETIAELGFLALAVSGVLLTGLWLRARYTISPSTVYRQAMVQLNSHPGLLEVMGAPLAGSDLRASVLTGGTLKFKGLTPKIRSRRLHMLFPLQGSERRGLASVEAKKRHGRYEFKLLAVDVPTAVGRDQRVFVIGTPRIYDRGGVLSELRDPFLRALSLEDAFEREDDEEDERDRAEKASRPGADLYFWERVYFAGLGAKDAAAGAAKRVSGWVDALSGSAAKDAAIGAGQAAGAAAKDQATAPK